MMGPFEQAVEDAVSEGSLSARHARDNMSYEPPDIDFGLYAVVPDNRLVGDSDVILKTGDTVYAFIPGIRRSEKQARELAYTSSLQDRDVQRRFSHIRYVIKLSGHSSRSKVPSEDLEGPKGTPEKTYLGPQRKVPYLEMIKLGITRRSSVM